MERAFFDSSALVKYYVQEPGSASGPSTSFDAPRPLAMIPCERGRFYGTGLYERGWRWLATWLVRRAHLSGASP